MELIKIWFLKFLYRSGILKIYILKMLKIRYNIKEVSRNHTNFCGSSDTHFNC